MSKQTNVVTKTCCLLFEKGNYLIEFIQNFIECDWKEELKEENVHIVNTEENKILYNLKLKEENIFFYLVIVSNNIKDIYLEILQDMVKIWRKYKARNITPIVPCVLYIGKNNKESMVDFLSVFLENKNFNKYIPDLKLELVDINNYSDDDLLSLRNVTGSVFYFNRGRGGKEKQKRLTQTIELIGKVAPDRKDELMDFYKEI